MVVVGGGYIGMEVAAAAVGWKLDTTVCMISDLEMLYYYGSNELIINNVYELLDFGTSASNFIYFSLYFFIY